MLTAPTSTELRLRLAELMMALSLATDLGVGQPIESALQSCLISVRLGQSLGLNDDELRDVYYLVFLAYVGCAADAHETARLFDEIALIADARTVDLGKPAEVLALMARRAGEGLPPMQRASRFVRAVAAGKSGPRNSVRAHCEVGQRLAESFGFGAVVQAELMQVFERWDGKGFPFGIRRDAMTLPVRVAPGRAVRRAFSLAERRGRSGDCCEGARARRSRSGCRPMFLPTCRGAATASYG